MIEQTKTPSKRSSAAKNWKKLVTAAMTLFAAAAAIIFLMPTVLTIANSFMSSSEISANYGAVSPPTNRAAELIFPKR